MSGSGDVDLFLDVDFVDGRRAGVERALRDALHSGKLRAGDRLPSTRALAADLGLSRATVVAAYEQLVAEGFLVSVPGGTTTVAEVGSVIEDTDDFNPLSPGWEHDFHPGRPDPSSFPRQAWQRASRRVLADTSDDDFGYPHPKGHLELRRALAGYLARARSMATSADAITVVGGFASALSLLGEHFARRGQGKIAVEDPMLFFHRAILGQSGVEWVPIPVDDDGLRVDRLAEIDDVAAVLTCPAHQYPLGLTMSAERRRGLVDWARNNDAWIIEDDYDGEFRYDRRPVGALQGLAPDRVIHVGTASKIVAPSLRLAWITTPAPLRAAVDKTINVRAGVSGIEQLVFAELINSGGLDRHVRSVRPRYRRRRERLRAALEDFGWLDPGPGAAGLTICARFTADARDLDDRAVVQWCAERGIGLVELSRHYARSSGSDDRLAQPFEGDQATPCGLVIGFGAPSEHHFPAALESLVAALADVRTV